MIYAWTGQPGAGKTIGALEYVMNDNQFENRPVYVYGVRGLNVEGWTEITKEQVLTWWELPEGSVVIIDECQDIWRPRGQGKEVPEHVQRLEKHRHLGFDFVLTFQFPTQIDTVVRHLITDHFHSHRAMGVNARTIYHWDGLCIDPLSRTKQKLATSKTRPFPKEIFEKYESASLHTAKPKIPLFVYALIPLVILIVGILIFLFNKISGLGDEFESSGEEGDVATESTSLVGGLIPQVASLDSNGNEVITAAKYLEHRKPRVVNHHYSAAIYDELNVARSLPRAHCLSSNVIRKGRPQCKCYTQQMTWLRSIDEEQCLAYIKDGYEFDYTVEENSDDSGRMAAESGADAAAPFPLLELRPARISAPSSSPSTIPRPTGF